MTILDDTSLYTVGWIAALPIERAAATALLDERHETPHGFNQHQSDTNAYTWGRVGEHNIVIASLPAGVYGTTSAATTALNLLSSLPQIRIGLLVGIGGAVARPDQGRDIRLGDVVVSQPEGTEGGVVQYDLGKATSNDSWERKGSLNMPPPVLLHALASLQAEHEISPTKVPDLLRGMWAANPQMTKPKPNAPAYVHQGLDNDRPFMSTYDHAGGGTCQMCDVSKEVQRNQRDTTDPYIHYGVIASGHSLIKDAIARDRIADDLGRKCVCFEMEAAGLMNHFPCLVIRGICDYADSHKNDRWQRSICEDVKNIQSVTAKVKEGVQDVRAIVCDIDQRNKDDKDQKCMRHLYVTDPREDKKRIQEAKGRLLKGCYGWILDHADFQRFREDSQSRLLWIKGDPGKGKTMLLCGIIDELEKRTNNLLSYFFCQATETQLSDAVSVLRGLIYLLIDRQRSLISYVRSKHDVTGEKLFQGSNVWFSLVEILREMLQDPTLKDAILIVDALDECTERAQLLDFIIQSSTFPSHIKWIIASRNWLDIEEKLDSAEQKVRLQLELNKDSISKAVDTYIGHKVEELAGLKNYDSETKETVRRHLAANADGTFLWVALVCKGLADTAVVRKRHTLSKLKLFPPGLDLLYERMMEQISGSNDANICKDILAITSVVYRPITLDELKVLVESLEKEDYNDLPQIITSCGSFLTLRGGVIYFVHQSARDFLLKKAYDEILPSGTAHRHYAIFSRSLETLSRTLRRDIYNLGAPGFPSDQISLPDPDPLASIRYSCVYWVDHLVACEPKGKMSEETLQDGGVVHDFIKKKYLNWLECLSLLRNTSEGVLAVQKLEALVRNAKAQELTTLLQDARRFILFHRRAMEIAPLQVYASALVFSPTRSLIREIFQEEEPHWVILKPRMESAWNACLQTLEGHGDFVTSVAFSADGQLLASGSSDKTVKVWDATTGACLQTLEGHDDWVRSVAISTDGQRLASGSNDGTVKAWDAGTGACLQTLEGHDDFVMSVVFSADGRRLASGSSDQTVKVWDATTGACVQTLEGHDAWVRSVAFSTDGQRLASGSSDTTVKVWDMATGACAQTLEGHGDFVMSVVFSADGRRLASGSSDKTVKVWDTATAACVQTFEGHDRSVLSVAFSADSQRLASGSDDKTVKVWDATTAACVQTLEGHDRSVLSVAFSADGQRLASGSDDKTVKVWDATTAACVQTLESHDRLVWSVAFSADGQRLASGSDDKTVKVWDTSTGACVQTLEGHGGWVRSVAFSADGQRLASGSSDKTVKVWDAITGARMQTLEGHDGRVRSVAFSADSQRLASGSEDKTIKVWDVAMGACAQTLEGHDTWVWSVAFSADGQRLASGSYDTTVKVWDTTTGACVQTLEGHGGWVWSVAFSADGQRLASGSSDKTVKVWDAATGACVRTFEIETAITHLSFDQTLLSTNIGLLNLNLQALLPATSQSTDATARGVRHFGWGISTDGVWIVNDGKRMLWLPPEFRGAEAAVVGSTIAIGCRSGRVLAMKFSQSHKQ
ncbi:hypothetical protein JDV02_001886 [Purpureocillium takamizusanense]|uniref:NACHT domain-containing protein n=1 Tax=Purpureocillium takamizusanense TaxID=2060973 RepID=A0A9Q8QAG4_9HYPO|nr:uncharacterized protein JDV02_001886 [Purpureocillium takamizusanense]UNI15346.1 hypothetical protein JDV02_001886 [Purpureocillium takamizusanense]